jgi:hypothetical protein
MEMTPQEQALEQLDQRMAIFWHEGAWVHEFRNNILLDPICSGLIDYLEIFDPDFILNQYLEEYLLRMTLPKLTEAERKSEHFLELLQKEIRALRNIWEKK